MKIGYKLKKARMDKNLTQEEVAEKIFVSRQSISNWENNKTYPDIGNVLAKKIKFESDHDSRFNIWFQAI